MCLAKAYLEHEGEEELLLEDIALIEIEGGRLRLSTLFGEEAEFDAVLKAIDFQGSRVIIEKRSRAA